MLLPRIYKIVGRILLLPALVLCAVVQFGHYVVPFLDFHDPARGGSIFIDRRYDYSDEVSVTLLIIALLLVAFGKRKNEDLHTSKIRQHAFYWSVVITWASTAVYFILTNFFERMGGPSRWLDFFFQLGNLFVLYNFLVPVVIFFPIFWYLRRKAKHDWQPGQFYLLPFPVIGLIGKCATLIFMAFGIINELFLTPNHNYSGLITLFPLALALWLCAKEPNESKELFDIRVKAVQLSIFIHYFLFILVYWLVYGWDYADALGASVISSQLIFLVVFYGMRFRVSKQNITAKAV